MRKFLVLLVLVSAFVLASCNSNEETPHTHSYTTYVSNNDATCTANGTETAKCDGCVETDTREAADSKLSHSFTTYASDDNATCAANGTETAKCDNCNETNTREVADSKLTHSFTNYVCDNNATVEADGTETAKCDNCDATDTRTDENSNQVVTDYMLDDERKYSGLLVNYLPEGEGTLIFVNSNCVYEGEFVNGLYHGEGTFNWSLDGSGWKFVGTFAEGKATYGKTTTNKVEGLIWYEGAMNDLNNIKAEELGTGYFDYANGCNYTGQMYASGALEGCTFHGDGVFKWSYDDSGWKFVGTFADGAATYGKTTTNKTSGLIWYEGAMNGLNNIKAEELGTGYYDYGNGCSYTGQMYASGALEGCIFHGEGTFRWPDGQTFVGTYNNGATVRGKLTYPNTMTYEGEFDGGYTFHGQGVFNWTTYNEDGSVKEWSNRYEGEFVNGGATGLTGTMYYARALRGENEAGLHYFTGIMATLGAAQTDQTGTGKIVFEDGSYYIGDVYLDASHVASVTGEGTYYYADGSTAERKVVTDHMLDDERKYTGVLVGNLPEGEGTLIFVNSNCKYTGSFVKGLYHGNGTFDWSLDGSGWKFVGAFAEGKATYGKTTTNKTEGLIWYEGAMNDLNNIKAEELGTGYYDYGNGCNYTGQMYASGALEGCTFHGDGVFKWSYDDSGWKFVGTFADGAATYGKTTTNKTSGLIWYEGAMNGLNNIKAEELGTGYYDYGNGCSYTGQMYASGALEGCIFHGEGTFRWPDGQTFVGTYNNGATVRGKLTYPNTMTYEGEFDGGYTFHGQGVFNWTTYNEDGSVKEWSNRYEGEFVNGGATGLTGTMYYVIALDGSNAAGLHYFTGVMAQLGAAQTDQTGTGKIVFGDGSYYIGDVYLDANHVASVTGTGVYYNADGSVKA